MYCNIAKFQNIMTVIVWILSVSSLQCQWWFQFLEKTLIWFKNVISHKELPISDDKTLLESNFEVNMQNTAYTKLLNLEF